MNHPRSRNRGAAVARLTGAAALIAAAVGCARPPAQVAQTKPTEVVFDYPVVKHITEYEDFTGRTEAVAAVDVRARVTGYLQEVQFKDGTDVQKGDLLFVIDPAIYQAEADRARASLSLAQARLDRVEKDYRRITALANKGAVTQAEADQISGERQEAEANVRVAEAARRLAQQNLDYTRVSAPLAGRISRRMIDPGNLVKADDTILTSIVSLDTIYAYFDIDERTLLKLRRLIQEGKMYSVRTHETHVQVGLADEERFSLDGVIGFTENKVDPATGTLRVRADVRNAPEKGVRLLSPGLFVRIRLPIGDPRPAVLVPEEAVGTDQGQKFVYVVTGKDEIGYRQVQLGQVYDGYRVVEKGLSPDERIVVSGLQRVRTGSKVSPKPVPGKKVEPGKLPDPAPKPAEPKEAAKPAAGKAKPTATAAHVPLP